MSEPFAVFFVVRRSPEPDQRWESGPEVDVIGHVCLSETGARIQAERVLGEQPRWQLPTTYERWFGAETTLRAVLADGSLLCLCAVLCYDEPEQPDARV